MEETVFTAGGSATLIQLQRKVQSDLRHFESLVKCVDSFCNRKETDSFS